MGLYYRATDKNGYSVNGRGQDHQPLEPGMHVVCDGPRGYGLAFASDSLEFLRNSGFYGDAFALWLIEGTPFAGSSPEFMFSEFNVVDRLPLELLVMKDYEPGKHWSFYSTN